MNDTVQFSMYIFVNTYGAFSLFVACGMSGLEGDRRW